MAAVLHSAALYSTPDLLLAGASATQCHRRHVDFRFFVARIGAKRAQMCCRECRPADVIVDVDDLDTWVVGHTVSCVECVIALVYEAQFHNFRT